MPDAAMHAALMFSMPFIYDDAAYADDERQMMPLIIERHAAAYLFIFAAISS